MKTSQQPKPSNTPRLVSSSPLRFAPSMMLSLCMMMFTVVAQQAMAQGGSAGPNLSGATQKVNSLLCQAFNFLNGPLGALAIVAGIIVAGIMIVIGSRNGTSSLMKAIGGGVVIGLATPLAQVGVSNAPGVVSQCTNVR
jgi:type IV secretory pathway VirB2 component (pilin)